jgi:hypothetical protein
MGRCLRISSDDFHALKAYATDPTGVWRMVEQLVQPDLLNVHVEGLARLTTVN